MSRININYILTKKYYEKNIRCHLDSIFLCTDLILSTSTGVVYIEQYNGLLGNQLFQFCLGKVLADELNFSLKCPPIFGFPETYLHNNVKLSAHLRTERLAGHVINFKAMCQNEALDGLKAVVSREIPPKLNPPVQEKPHISYSARTNASSFNQLPDQWCTAYESDRIHALRGWPCC